MYAKLNREESKEARYIVRECILSRFNRTESLAYLKQKLKRNDLSMYHLDYIKRSLKSETKIWINSLMKTRYAYVNQYKERLDELVKYQKEYWRLYHLNTGNGFLQKQILDSLQDTTIAITQLYDILPEITTDFATISANAKEKESTNNATVPTTNSTIPPIE
jgi:hypothetical protein